MKNSAWKDLLELIGVGLLGILLIAVALGSVVGLLLGIWWLIWSLWIFVLPQIWTTGPQNFINPSYWLFVGAWVLAGLIGRGLFKR